MKEQEFGLDHINPADTIINIGDIHNGQGKYAKALFAELDTFQTIPILRAKTEDCSSMSSWLTSCRGFSWYAWQSAYTYLSYLEG